MWYCVSNKQPYSVLKKADEIKVEYNDRNQIMDFIEKVSDKSIVLDFPGYAQPEWNTWKMYSEMFNEFHIALHDLNRWKEFSDANVKWYWPYPITSFYELRNIVSLNPSYIMIGPPLSFSLEVVKNITNNIPIRMIPNNARPEYLPAAVAFLDIQGQWVRPEDVAAYEKYVKTFEFDADSLDKEETLLHIYSINKSWPGNLNLLISNLNYNIDNRLIPEELVEKRLNCGQKCMANSSCHLCQNSFLFATRVRDKKLKIDK